MASLSAREASDAPSAFAEVHEKRETQLQLYQGSDIIDTD